MARGISAALVVAFFAWLIGESVDELGMKPKLVILFALPILVAVAVFLMSPEFLETWQRIAVSAAFASVAAIALYGGVRCYARAFKSCIGQSERIRDTIEWYGRAHRGYPPHLRDALLDLPCQRCVRGTILRYSATRTHYVLSFSDALISWKTADHTGWKVANRGPGNQPRADAPRLSQ